MWPARFFFNLRSLLTTKSDNLVLRKKNYEHANLQQFFFRKLIKLSEWGIFAKGVGCFLKLNTMTSHCEKFGYKIWREKTVTLFSWYAFSQNTNYYHFPLYSVSYSTDERILYHLIQFSEKILHS